MTTYLGELTYTERAEVERLAQEIRGTGVGTIDLPRGSRVGGKRHRFREPLQQLLGYRIDMGRDKDATDGSPFLWFMRHEEDNAVDPETQAARERLGFAQ